MTSDLDDLAALFQRIDTVMARVTGCALSEIFRPPATEALLLNAEGVIGIRLPEDLRQAYLWHDGNSEKHYMGGTTVSLPSLIRPSYRWVSLEELMTLWLMFRDGDRAMCESQDRDVWIALSGDQGFERESEPTLVSFYDKKRIPVANSDANTWVCVDLNPSRWGTHGQLVQHAAGNEQPDFIATSFTECLRRVTDALDDGRYAFHPTERMWLSQRTGERPWTLDDL